MRGLQARTPIPTGLRAPAQSTTLSNQQQPTWPFAVGSAVTAVVGIGITTVGVTVNPVLVLPGVALTMEGMVGLSVVAAGGTPKDVLDVQEGFKYAHVNQGETLVLKAVETYSTKHDADTAAATKNVIQLLVGDHSIKSAGDAVKALLDLGKWQLELWHAATKDGPRNGESPVSDASDPRTELHYGHRLPGEAGPLIPDY